MSDISTISFDDGLLTGNEKHPREDDDATSHALKDRRSSMGAGLSSRAHGGDFNNSAEEEEGVKPGKVSQKRKEQNRNAQRAFRERKEKHMSTLETRIDSLEQKNNEQGAENDALKQLLARLQEENERLRVGEHSSNSAAVMPVNPFSFSSGGFDFGSAVPFTAPPPISFPSTSNLPLPTPTYHPSLTDLSSILPFAATSNENFSFLDTGLPSPTTLNSDFNFTYSADRPLSIFSASNGVSPLSNPDPAEESSASSSSARSARSPSTPPSLDYRDGFSNLKDQLPAQFEFGEEGDLDDFSAFLAASPVPIEPESKSISAVASAGAGSGIYPCYGKPEGYKFDLDGLCSDMASKATCQEAARALLQEAMKEDAAQFLAFPQ